jgi:hypothetical protein
MGRGSEKTGRITVLDFESAVREPSDIAALGLFVGGVRGVSECLSVWWFQAIQAFLTSGDFSFRDWCV